MDDFVIFHQDKLFLSFVREQIKQYLEELKLTIHEKKCHIFMTSKGVPYLGQIISSHRRRLKRENVVRFKRRLRRFQRLYQTGKVARQHIHQSIQSWIGHASHANSMKLRELIFSDIVFRKEKGD
jgi:hypothetical protein